MMLLLLLSRFGDQGGVENHGRCWYLGAEGATCGQTCAAQAGFRFSAAQTFEVVRRFLLASIAALPGASL